MTGRRMLAVGIGLLCGLVASMTPSSAAERAPATRPAAVRAAE